jgi:hypothetical protein
MFLIQYIVYCELTITESITYFVLCLLLFDEYIIDYPNVKTNENLCCTHAPAVGNDTDTAIASSSDPRDGRQQPRCSLWHNYVTVNCRDSREGNSLVRHINQPITIQVATVPTPLGRQLPPLQPLVAVC